MFTNILYEFLRSVVVQTFLGKQEQYADFEIPRIQMKRFF